MLPNPVAAGEKYLRWGCIIFGIFNSVVTMGLLALWHALPQASTLFSIINLLKHFFKKPEYYSSAHNL